MPARYIEMACSRCSAPDHIVRSCQIPGVIVAKRFREHAKRAEWRRANPNEARVLQQRKRSTPKAKARHNADVKRAYAKDPSRARNRSRAWVKANPDRVLSGSLARLYGLSLLDYATLLLAQWFRCAVCSKENDFSVPRGRLFVDHDHNAAPRDRRAVRGLLCLCCNSALGKFRDDPVLCSRAAAYITTER